MASGSKIVFKLTDLFYDSGDVLKEYDKVKPQKQVANLFLNILDKAKKRSKAPIKDDPYILNAEKQVNDKTFQDGYGVDFYLDACRFLPDNTSIVKCVVRVVDLNNRDVFPPTACLSKLSKGNDALNPIFHFRHEYRKEQFNPTSMIMITFLTIDKSNSECRIVGYSAINLFERKYQGGQPESPNETDIVLKSGLYQLSIYAREPLRIFPFNIARINKLVELPCASVLIGINSAPQSDDLKRVLSLKDFS